MEKKKKLNILLWWRIDSAKMLSEVAHYDSLKFFKTSRGFSVGLLLFSSLVTALFAYAKNTPATDTVYVVIAVAIMLILSLFIGMGQRWAIIAAMAYWTFEKGYQFFNAPHPFSMLLVVIWWCLFMHVFYRAFAVEQERARPLKAKGLV